MHSILKLVRIGIRAAGILVILASVILVLSLMVPFKVWRTGELSTEPIQVRPAEPFGTSPVRVWIDTDAACGQGQRTDPDDCLAILLLAQQDHIHLVGVSTIFGNARLNETDRVTRDLIDVIEKSGRRTVPVYSGTPEPLNESIKVAHRHEAHEALRNALKEPLVIVALGPLTNIAIALKYHPPTAGQRDATRRRHGPSKRTRVPSGRRRHGTLILGTWPDL